LFNFVELSLFVFLAVGRSRAGFINLGPFQKACYEQKEGWFNEGKESYLRSKGIQPALELS